MGDVALQRDPAVLDLDLDGVRRDHRIPREHVEDARAALLQFRVGVAHDFGQRFEHAPGRDMADTREVFLQHMLLGADLLVLVQVLQHAAGADAEMRARRRHALRAGLKNLLSDPRWLRPVNVGLAVLLLASLVPMLRH